MFSCTPTSGVRYLIRLFSKRFLLFVVRRISASFFFLIFLSPFYYTTMFWLVFYGASLVPSTSLFPRSSLLVFLCVCFAYQKALISSVCQFVVSRRILISGVCVCVFFLSDFFINNLFCNILIYINLFCTRDNDRFNRYIDAMTWPQGIEELRLGPGFNRPIQSVPWPLSLLKLEFCGELQQRIEDITWPSALKHLSLLGDFNQVCHYSVFACRQVRLGFVLFYFILFMFESYKQL